MTETERICQEGYYIVARFGDALSEMLNCLALWQLIRHKGMLGNIQRVSFVPLAMHGCHFHKPGDFGYTIRIDASDTPSQQLCTLLHEAVEIKVQSLKKGFSRGKTFQLSKQAHQAVEGCAGVGAPLISELFCCLGPFNLCL